MMKLRWVLPLILALILPLLTVRAHGYVVRAIPADRSTLERPPTRLQYWFSEDLEPRFSDIKLRDQSGEVIASGAVDARNHALLSLRVPAGLGDGAYIVELRPAFASDGHVIAESRVFFVGEEVGGVTGSAADDRAHPLEVIWRAGLNLANFLFFGASLLYTIVLLPAWGNPRNPLGILPSRVMRRLRNCLAAAVALALIANLVALLQQSMVFFNADALQVIQQNLWGVVLIGSRFGDVWIFRMVLLIFCAVLIFAAEFYRALMPQLSAGIWRGMPWLGALFIGLTMVTSHAAGSTLMPWLAITVDWLHALAAAFWTGGALALTLLLPAALASFEGERRRQAIRAVMLRFSRMVTPLVALMIVSGIYNAANFFVSPADLDSAYGRTLAVKLLLIAPLLFIGAWQHIILRPRLAARLQRACALLPQSLHTWMGQTVSTGKALRLEIMLMLALLGAVAWLSATPIPEPKSLRKEIETPQATQIVGDYTITSAIMPGGPGVNTYDSVVWRGAAPATDVELRLQLVNPQRGIRSLWHPMEQVEAGLYAAAGDDIDETGEWWSLVDIVSANGAVTRAAAAWAIHEAAAVTQSRPPHIGHFALLLGILFILGSLVQRRARRLLSALNLGPATALLAVGALVVSVAVMVAGALMINERQRQYEETLHPPPEQVNTVLPDAESLGRGEALYRVHCLVWQGQSADFRALRNRLGRARDDFLYGVVAAGWRELPACQGDLSEQDRWDIVNYFRTFEER
ncbi:MAG: CopD family protein, partial [Chloroflexi bacterium]|nr:CopD family protein [Chloroflexota bacterium]